MHGDLHCHKHCQRLDGYNLTEITLMPATLAGIKLQLFSNCSFNESALRGDRFNETNFIHAVRGKPILTMKS